MSAWWQCPESRLTSLNLAVTSLTSCENWLFILQIMFKANCRFTIILEISLSLPPSTVSTCSIKFHMAGNVIQFPSFLHECKAVKASYILGASYCSLTLKIDALGPELRASIWVPSLDGLLRCATLMM